MLTLIFLVCKLVKQKIAGTSMMVLTIDNEIPDTVMQQIINLDGIFDAKLVNYYTV